MDNSPKLSPVELDEVDFVLIKELELDARQSNMDLAAKLGISAATVKRRIQRLADGRIIRFFAMAHPDALGLHMQALVGINALPGQVDSLATSLASYRCVRAINLTTGRYDMLVSTIHESRAGLLEFVDWQLGNAPGLVSAETMMVMKVAKTSLRHFEEGGTQLGDVNVRPLEDAELRLIRELERDPRETITGLSKKLGMTRPAVARKLNDLRADNIISIGCMAKASAFDLNVQTCILIRASNGNINSVARFLAENKKTYHVLILAGRFDICAWTRFKDVPEMSASLRIKPNSIPGVVHVETMFQVGVPKLSLSLSP